MAALLHDADDRKLFHSENYENARSILLRNQVDEKRIEKICDIIASVSFKGSDTIEPNSIEGKIVQDADRLDAIGAIGIARAFAYCAKVLFLHFVCIIVAVNEVRVNSNIKGVIWESI